MRIRNRLTISFSLVAIGILLLFASAIYYFSSYYRKSEFNNRLQQRVEITEKIFLERDSFDDDDYTRIQEQFLNKLPEETEEVVRVEQGFNDKLTHPYPEDFIEQLLVSREAYFNLGPRQGAGKIFDIGGTDFMVLITAVDYVGNQMMEHLITVIVIVLTISIIVMVASGYILSGSLLNPISMKIHAANSISARNLSERLTVINPDDEMGELAIAFNNMLDRVEEAFAMQRLFIDNASHEIRNPLTAIIGETEYSLEKTRTPEEYVESLKSISHEADRLNALVNDLLQLAGVSHKEITFSKHKLTVKELLDDAIQKVAAQNPENKIRVRIETDELNDETQVQGNHHLLVTAFFNLIENACKFSSFDEVTISITRISQQSIRIRVQDRGIGIPPDDLKKIYQPFHRAANVRQMKGTGIGIPLTLKIIELHMGELHVDSELGISTTATVVLPVVE